MKCSMWGFLKFYSVYFCYRIVGMVCDSFAFVSWCDVVAILGASGDSRSFEGVEILYNVTNNTA